jgi:hypothetical protein
MSVTNWVKSRFSRRGKAVSLYQAGMAKANKHDYEGAIAAYSAAIRESNVPPDVKGMILYNRALAYSAVQQHAESAHDLETLLETPGLPAYIKTQAKQRQERLRRRKDHAGNL